MRSPEPSGPAADDPSDPARSAADGTAPDPATRDAGTRDTGSPGAERAGTPDDETDRDPLGARDEAIAAATTDGAQTGVLASERAEPRSHRRSRGSALGHIREPELVNFWRGWLGRAIALLFGVLVLGTAFIASYVGALHDPMPRDLPVGVVSGDAAANALLVGVRAQAGTVLAAREYPTAKAAADALAERRVYAVLASDGSSTANGLSLTVAGAAAPGAAEVITQAVSAGAGAAQVPLVVVDTHPLAAGDPRGLTAFYTVVGLLIGGYLAATALAIALGTVPRNLDRLGLRLAAFGVLSLLMGLSAAILTGPVYDIWHGRFLGLWLAGALICFVGAVVTAALESWLGLVGTGVAMLLLFIVGNPGSGGVFAPQFLPGPYGTLHRWIPTGLAADLLRGVAYFDRRAIGWPVTGLVLWAALGLAGVLGATAVLGRRAQVSR